MKTITISEETYESIKDQLQEKEKIDISSLQDIVGHCYLIRTVTYHLTGRIKKIIGNMIILEDAAWIADSGRLMNAIKNGKLNEVEPVGDALVNIDAITDMFPWSHPLPIKQL